MLPFYPEISRANLEKYIDIIINKNIQIETIKNILTDFLIFKPSNRDELKEAVNSIYKTNKYIVHPSIWDLSLITDTSYLFYKCTNVPWSIEEWNTSNVINMRCMFYNCNSFNQPLNKWNISKVTNAAYMFINVTNLNKD